MTDHPSRPRAFCPVCNGFGYAVNPVTFDVEECPGCGRNVLSAIAPKCGTCRDRGYVDVNGNAASPRSGSAFIACPECTDPPAQWSHLTSFLAILAFVLVAVIVLAVTR